MAEDSRRAWPPAPEPLPVPVTDNHTHITLDPRENAEPRDLGEHLRLAAAAGVTRMIEVGYDIDSSRRAVELAEEHAPIAAGVALHPNEAPRLAAEDRYDEAMAEIARLAAMPGVLVIGETGLDTYRTGPEGRDAQRRSFREHIALAKELDLVLQIHDRDAHRDVVEVLLADGAPERTVFHCFSGDREFAEVVTGYGWHLSIAGTVTFKNARDLQDAVRWAPAESLLVETDAPYLTPMPYRGRPNSPYLVPHTLRAIATLKDMDLAAACAVVQQNTDNLYGTW